MEGYDLGLVAYNFEPEYSDAELAELELRQDSDTLLSVDEYCECSNCEEMPNNSENVCCHTSDLTTGNLDDMDCITEHPDFEHILCCQMPFYRWHLFKYKHTKEIVDEHPTS